MRYCGWVLAISQNEIYFDFSPPTYLDEGESEAITLFIEQPSQAILLDEKSARRVAKQMNLPVLGTVGILIWAKQNGLIPNLKEQLDSLQFVGKFRLSNLIYQEAIKKVCE